MAKKSLKSRKPNELKEVPFGVKVISIIYYIGAVFGLIASMLLLTGAEILKTTLIAIYGPIISDSFTAIAVFILLFSIFSFFVGFGLWKCLNWARIAAIVISCINALSAVVSVALMHDAFGNFLNILINGFIIAYLGFNAVVQKIFGVTK